MSKNKKSAAKKSAAKKSAKSTKYMSIMLKHLGMIDFEIDKSDNITFPFDNLFAIEETVAALVEAEKRISHEEGFLHGEAEVEDNTSIAYENGKQDAIEDYEYAIETDNAYGIR